MADLRRRNGPALPGMIHTEGNLQPTVRSFCLRIIVRRLRIDIGRMLKEKPRDANYQWGATACS